MADDENVSIVAEVHENPFADFVRSIAMAVTPIVSDTVKQFENENGRGPISTEKCAYCGKIADGCWADLYVPTNKERTNFDRYVICEECSNKIISFTRNSTNTE